MKLTQVFLVFAAVTGVLGGHSPGGHSHAKKDEVQTANFKFHGDDSGSYKLSVKADGKPVKTENNRLKVKTVDSNDYKGDTLCTWKTPDGKTVKPVMHTNATDGSQALVFDKPTAIGSVSCKGKCVPVGKRCYNQNVEWTGPCCNGYCAATLCRSWDAKADDK